MLSYSKDEAIKAIENIQKDFSASFWLKGALNTSLKRDCIDALNDVEVLYAILKARVSN